MFWEKSCLGSDTNIEWKLGEGESSTYNTFTLLIHFVRYLFIYFYGILRLKYGCYLIVYPVPIAISKPLTRCYQLADPGDFGLSE